jgi:hypothetical protein
MADAFPDAKAGWVEKQVGDLWTVEMSGEFEAQNRWIAERSPFDLESFARVQLSRGNFSKDVFDGSRRRLTIDENRIQACWPTVPSASIFVTTNRLAM